MTGVLGEKLTCLTRSKMSTKSERGAEEVVKQCAVHPQRGR